MSDIEKKSLVGAILITLNGLIVSILFEEHPTVLGLCTLFVISNVWLNQVQKL